MRLSQLLERNLSAIDQLRANPPVDDRSERDKSDDEADNRVYPNPLPFLSPRDPRWADWMDRGEAATYEYMEKHGMSYKNGDAGAAHSAVSQTAVLPINQLISTERFLNPDALERPAGSKASSPRPFVYKIDGNYLIADGNNRVVQAFLNKQTEVEVDVMDVDEYERVGL